MKRILFRVAPACAIVVGVSLLAAAMAADRAASSGDHSGAAVVGDASANPKDGFREYKDTFKVQQPYDLSKADRFSEDGQVYTCWVNKSDKPFKEGSGTGARTEMRWLRNWTRDEHMWEGDIMFEPGTEHTCLMQVKSNTGREAVYLQVEHGNLYNDSDHKHVLLEDATGKWFHVLAAYNPTTGVNRVWINGELKLSGHYPRPIDTIWYFKNGVYNASGTSKAHFKNIHFYETESAKPEHSKQAEPELPGE